MVHVGYKGGKMRDIDLVNTVRRPLYTYLQQADRDQDSPYVFCSQRAARFTEAGIHHWFRSLKARANKERMEFDSGPQPSGLRTLTRSRKLPLPDLPPDPTVSFEEKKLGDYPIGLVQSPWKSM